MDSYRMSDYLSQDEGNESRPQGQGDPSPEVDPYAEWDELEGNVLLARIERDWLVLLNEAV